MAVNLQDVYRRGGRQLVDLLEYCVISLQMDPVFVFLVDEYRMQPTRERAMALYDMFCAPDAPAKVSMHEALPPRNLGLQQAVETIREQHRQLQSADSDDEADDETDRRSRFTVPMKNLFDAVVRQLETAPGNMLVTVGREYDPGLTPHQNLPGGRMTAGQRAFVEKIWEPVVRPQLVSAGFWRIANVA